MSDNFRSDSPRSIRQPESDPSRPDEQVGDNPSAQNFL